MLGVQCDQTSSYYHIYNSSYGLPSTCNWNARTWLLNHKHFHHYNCMWWMARLKIWKIWTNVLATKDTGDLIFCSVSHIANNETGDEMMRHFCFQMI